MNWQNFLIGICSLLLAYPMFRSVKGVKPHSKKNNWTGPTQKTIVEYWTSINILTFLGVAFILKSLPSQI
jgi:hypothetical protein